MLQDRFPPAMVAACKKALADGVFYEDQFKDVVRVQMGGPGFTPALLESGRIDTEDFATRRAMLSKVKKIIAEAPRGAYAVAEIASRDSTSYEYYMSKGNGEVHSPMGARKLTEDALVDDFLRMDIYECRRAVEIDASRARDVVAFNMLQIAVGQIYKNFRDAGETFAKVAIVGVFPDTGNVKVHCTKRGSKRIWEGSFGAVRLAKGLNLLHDHQSLAQADMSMFSLPESESDTGLEEEQMPAPR